MASFDVNTMIILLVLAVALILVLKSGSSIQLKGKSKFSPDRKDYFIGLNYLLNDEPDDAVDIFINGLEINAQTLDTHIALGTLLRRRGKVDRSIEVLQNLLAWPDLNNNEQDQVKIRLVKSYIAAGLLDRAEKLLDELKASPSDIKEEALNLLINVYQQEKDWFKAVEACDELIKISSSESRIDYQLQASHYFCELAENEINLGHKNSARDYLKKSSQFYRYNIRTQMLKALLEFEAGNVKKTISLLGKISTLDKRFEPEVFELLLQSYVSSGNRKDIEKFIQKTLENKPGNQVIIQIAQFYTTVDEYQRSIKILEQYLEKQPSLSLLAEISQLQSESSAFKSIQQENGQDIAILNDQLLQKSSALIQAFLDTKNNYKCDNCGFELKKMHWLCPGCGKWNSVKPLLDEVLNIEKTD